ncbi:formyltetrahydrofolate deformylase [Candidatus Liberibacter africanus PTSAPSY]|uniref:Formyltetrahydrofolate deformylase n=2 Tax=Liberibacter africanus TaxID=34020 RepID=A0A0G3I3Q9_LIBAF|nr:formyltetrahydrofolate deformylase [Candidatus Liberibacter africanus PTSAPSY]
MPVISRYLVKKDCNILCLSQFDDLDTRFFFLRVNFTFKNNTSIENFLDDFQPIIQQFSMKFSIRNAKKAVKTLILVSRLYHCLHDLLYRWNMGTLNLNIIGVVSNHLLHKQMVENYHIPFHYIPVTQKTRIQSEKKLIEIIDKHNVGLIVLARYMQIISDQLCSKMAGRIINVHHSFLPSFKGAHPYKQAYEYGVKIIGATAHYVTSELDAGPIIAQDVKHITHAQNVEDYSKIGKKIEAKVLTSAVTAHIQHRVFINKRKTIVFPDHPNNYSE